MIAAETRKVGEFRWEGKPQCFACKICDKVFTTENALRIHMAEHERNKNILFDCEFCDFVTNDSTIHRNHICTSHGYTEAVVHGPRNPATNPPTNPPTNPTTNQTPNTTTNSIPTEVGGVQQNKKCNNCGLVLNKSADLVAHIVTMHGFNYSGPIRNKHYPMKHQVLPPKQANPVPTNQTSQTKPNQTSHNTNIQSLANFKCFDCPNKFNSKHELHQHKRQVHSKQKLCSYYHGTGRGCRFPANECFNIHNENITPTVFDNTDFRSRIPCRHGDICSYHQRGECYYMHVPHVEQSSTNRTGSRNTRSDNTGQKRVDSSSEEMMMSALIRMNSNLETLSERLQFLDPRSMQDFPNLANVPMRN